MFRFLIPSSCRCLPFWLQSGEDAQKLQVPQKKLHLNGNTNKQQISNIHNLSHVGKSAKPYRPRPPPYFHGYTLPQDHPCNKFTLPPPPADKKRTGPRRKISFLILTLTKGLRHIFMQTLFLLVFLLFLLFFSMSGLLPSIRRSNRFDAKLAFVFSYS